MGRGRVKSNVMLSLIPLVQRFLLAQKDVLPFTTTTSQKNCSGIPSNLAGGGSIIEQAETLALMGCSS